MPDSGTASLASGTPWAAAYAMVSALKWPTTETRKISEKRRRPASAIGFDMTRGPFGSAFVYIEIYLNTRRGAGGGRRRGPLPLPLRPLALLLERRGPGQPRRQRAQRRRDQLAVDRQVAVLAVAPADQDAGVGQDLEVVRDRRLRHREALADLPARQLAGRADLLDHLEPLGVGQGL